MAKVQQAYPDYTTIGGGYGNLLSYGVFDLDSTGTNMLLKRGRAAGGSQAVSTVDVAQISESISHSWYSDSVATRNPASGRTTAQYPKTGAYSWLKAPRYSGTPYEAGPLARMWVNGDYRKGISVMDRHQARAAETLKIATALQSWVTQLQATGPVYTPHTPATTATAYGLTEAPRGALGHWLQIASGKISRYQIITPTCWNASPRDGSQNWGL